MSSLNVKQHPGLMFVSEIKVILMVRQKEADVMFLKLIQIL